MFLETGSGDRWTVLVADVIDSRSYSPSLLSEAMREVRKAAASLGPSRYVSMPEAVMGDELQAVPQSVKEAVTAIIRMEQAILSTGTGLRLRIALVVGRLEGFEEGHRLVERSGSAIIEARRLMEQMKRTNRRSVSKPSGRIRFQLNEPTASVVLNDAFSCWTGIIDAWDARYLRIATELIEGATDDEAAARFGMTRSAIWKRRQALGIDQFLACRSLIEHLVDETSLDKLRGAL